MPNKRGPNLTPKPFFGRGVLREGFQVSSPLVFPPPPTPPRHALRKCQRVTLGSLALRPVLARNFVSPTSFQATAQWGVTKWGFSDASARSDSSLVLEANPPPAIVDKSRVLLLFVALCCFVCYAPFYCARFGGMAGFVKDSKIAGELRQK